MDAVEFLKEEHRLCTDKSCERCPLNVGMSCIHRKQKYPEDYVAIVEKWAKENPMKKNLDKFREVFGIGPSTIAPSCWGLDLNWWNAEYKEPKR